MSAKKLSPVAEAYQRCEAARKVLREIGRCMEVTEDKCGILWERWIVPTGENSFVNVIVYATPHMWDVFTPIHNGPKTDETLAALRALAHL